MPCKILSDFDGVWTDQHAEAAHATAYLIEAAARAADAPLAEAREHFRVFMEATMRSPQDFGWAPDGRITAFVDEDPLLQSSALACYLDGARDDLARRYRDAVLAGPDATLPDFGNRCFLEATGQFREEHPPSIVHGAREILEAWHDAGAEVVVVSNSGADKLIGWFRHAGIDAGETEGHLLRVRGNARKWEIAGDERLEAGGRSIYVDRPRYLEAIEEERPDLILGDVFSLDLALAHVMRQRGHERAPARLVLRRHAHTPAWVAGLVGDVIDAAIDGLDGLVEVMAGMEA